MAPKVDDEIHQFISKNCFWKRGLTWGLKKHDCKYNTDLVSCHGAPNAPTFTGSCNPYSGDTRCLDRRPILCIHKAHIPRPPTYVGGCSGCAISDPAFYYGWSEGMVRATDPVWGCSLSSKKAADEICRKYFGCGFEMASHHDSMWIKGMTTSTEIYGDWVSGTKYGGGW